jgi:hypothetical protein
MPDNVPLSKKPAGPVGCAAFVLLHYVASFAVIVWTGFQFPKPVDDLFYYVYFPIIWVLDILGILPEASSVSP